MRTKEQALRACPTCGTKGVDMGLRDYASWVNAVLPGKAGGTDFDCVVERRGNFLMFEFKPNKYIGRGQAAAFDALHAQGWDILIVVDKDLKQDKLEISAWGTPVWHTIDLEYLRQVVSRWWDEASNTAKGSGSKHLLATLESPGQAEPAIGTKQARAVRGLA